jgi:hypothetical protein
MEMLQPWNSSLCPPSIHSRTIHHDPPPHLARLSEPITCYSLTLLQRNSIVDGLTSSKAGFPTNGPIVGPTPWDLKLPRHVSAPLSNPYGTTYTTFGSFGTTTKNDTRSVVQYKQQALDSRISQQYNQFTATQPPPTTSSNNITLTSHKKNFFFYHTPSTVPG